jgi:hypothetical protein
MSVPVLWRINVELFNILPYFQCGQANMVFVSNGSYFVAGYNQYHSTMDIGDRKAVLWEKSDENNKWRYDEMIQLPASSRFAVANSVFVSNGDVYVAGDELIDVDATFAGLVWEATRAVLWKNGAIHQILAKE